MIKDAENRIAALRRIGKEHNFEDQKRAIYSIADFFEQMIQQYALLSRLSLLEQKTDSTSLAAELQQVTQRLERVEKTMVTWTQIETQLPDYLITWGIKGTHNG